MKLSNTAEYAIYGMFAKMGKLQKIDRHAELNLVENGHKITVAFGNTCGQYFGIIYPTDKGVMSTESKVFFVHDIETLKTTLTAMAAMATNAVADYLSRLADKEVA